jgi:hypothetical protein
MQHNNQKSLYKLTFSAILLTLCSICTVAKADTPLRGGELQSKAEHTFGKVEVRMYSQKVTGTTSTFFWWKDGGHLCGQQWNEIDIETLPVNNTYQSNPIWQTSDNDCEIKRSEGQHGANDNLYGRWVVYTLEWTPDYISWSHDGIEDRRISRGNHPAIAFIQNAMKYCFNLWTQGNTNPGWLGNIDFDALHNQPVYQFVDYFKFYDWNGNGFNELPTTNIEFTSMDDVTNNFNVSTWEFGESKGNVTWSDQAVGVADVGNGNGALWLGLFHKGKERAPLPNEIPSEAITPINNAIQAENYVQMSGIETETTNDIGGGMNVGYIDPTDWMTYRINLPRSGNYTINYRVASATGGVFQFEQAGGGVIYHQVNVPATGGWQNWQTLSKTVNLNAGQQDIALASLSGAWNINWFELVATDTAGDLDNDGISDNLDICPNTAEGLIVDENGCALFTYLPSDSDNDSVENSLDSCPNTQENTQVDANGCAVLIIPIDSDNDGVEDGLDTCPNTPSEVIVDNNGCQVSNIDNCAGINIYPNWTANDWPGTANTHNEGGDLMQHQGNAYIANWYTSSLPGSDYSWSFFKSCN